MLLKVSLLSRPSILAGPWKFSQNESAHMAVDQDLNWKIQLEHSITTILSKQTACGRPLISESLLEPSSHRYRLPWGISFITTENHKEALWPRRTKIQKVVTVVTMATTLQRLLTAILNHLSIPVRPSGYRLHCYIAFRRPFLQPFIR